MGVLVFIIIVILFHSQTSCLEEQEFLLTFQPFIGDPELDPVCPSEEDIYPCLCYIVDDHLMNLDCSQVLDENELFKAFISNFPDTTFNKLHLDGNMNIKILREGILDRVTFSEIIFHDGNLETVESRTFSSSSKTATKLAFVSNKIRYFPFGYLEEFPLLTDLYLTDNQIRSFPSIVSESLKVLSLAHNPIGVLPSSAFLGLPGLVSIDLDQTDITVINPGTFSHLSSLAYLFLGYNRLFTLEDEDLAFMSSNMSIISLSNNNIKSISPMAITGVGEGVTVFLDNNGIENIAQDIWETLLLSNVQLVLTDNPIICDCSLHWIVKNTTFRNLIKYANCRDGSDIMDLDLEGCFYG